MRLFAMLLLFVAISIFAQGASLRKQLELAQKDEDTYAQIELTRRLLDQEPNNAGLHDELIALWLGLPDYNMADEALHDWKDAPADTRASVTAAVLFNRDDKKREAIALLADFHAKNPADIEITRQLTKYLKSLEETEKIITLLQTAPGVNEAADLLAERSLARRAMNDYDGALVDFAAAKAIDSTESTVYSNNASNDRLANALPHIKDASAILAKDPTNLAALIDRAFWFNETGFAYRNSLTDANAALKAVPNSVGVLMLYVQAANSAGKLSARDALDKFQVDANRPSMNWENLDQLLKLDDALAKKPTDVPLLLARASLLNEALDQYRLALVDADKVLTIDPKNGKARLLKIYSFIKMAQPNEAAAELRAIEAAKPSPEKLSEALTYFANTAFGAEKLELALEYANRALNAKPTVDLYKLRAAIFQRLYRTAEAQADLAKASQLEKKK